MKTRVIGQDTQKQDIAAYPSDPIARKKAIDKSYRDRNKEQYNARARQYYLAVKRAGGQEAYNRRNREQYARTRDAALIRIAATYGVVCRCCGEFRKPFLAIHHVDGGGNKHRRSFKSQHGYYKYLATEAPLDKFQILCHNCNIAKCDGPCPHELERMKAEAA